MVADLRFQYRNKFLPKGIKIVGYARTNMDHEEYLRRVRSYIKTPTKEIEEQLDSFCQFCTYISGQYDKDDSFINLNKHLEEIEKGQKEQNRIYYMALPPSVFTTVSDQLKRNCYPKNGVARIIVSQSWAGITLPLVIILTRLFSYFTGREAFRQGPSELARSPKSPGA